MPSVGDSIATHLAAWSFAGPVADSFDEHVSRSVPGYFDGHKLVTYLSDFFLASKSPLIVDIGCSTGSLLEKIHARHSNRSDVNYLGIDPVEDMVRVASARDFCSLKNVSFIVNDVLNVDLERECSLIISYYTLQFIHPSVRQNTVDWIYNNLSWGGGLLLFEKIRMPDARFQDYMTQSYNDFKLAQGYTPEEILTKSASLKGVLEPFSESGNLDLLKRAGFIDIAPIFQNIVFKGWLAIK